MNERIMIMFEETAIALRSLNKRIERLEGVTGPEQSLVGESRSDEQPDGAEERSERSERSVERSGVGKIVDAIKLLRHIDCKMDEALEAEIAAQKNRNVGLKQYWAGKGAALGFLADYVDQIAEKRSDLSNDKGMAVGRDGSPHAGETL
jgi:hypothetical protein